jgi:D-sedoheptulose 7-phosphate isomerase
LKNFIDTFFNTFASTLENVQCSGRDGAKMERSAAYDLALHIALEATSRGNKLMFIGNGGSAAIASHMAIDFSKNGQMPAMCFNDGAALTCLGNDYGYEEVFAQQLHFHAHRGKSQNILRAVDVAQQIGCSIITLSGFAADNPLRSLGEVNFYVALSDYGLVEVAHTALIHAVVELKRASTLTARTAD